MANPRHRQTSGSGKSTLSTCSARWTRRPRAGIVRGQKPAGHDARGKAHFRNKKLGFVFQFHHLLPEFSTEENVAMQALIAGMNRSKALGLARRASNASGFPTGRITG
ncbi:MAG: ATP-binding cassette domain-containing protein [Bilophila wadsworthia]